VFLTCSDDVALVTRLDDVARAHDCLRGDAEPHLALLGQQRLDDVADGHDALHLGPAGAVRGGGRDARDVADALLRHDLHGAGPATTASDCLLIAYFNRELEMLSRV